MVRARNRKQLESFGPGVELSNRFASTQRRVDRLSSVIARRQPTLTVVLEDVYDPHNASAVLRSCDAVGVLDVHLVYVKQKPPERSFSRSASGSAAKWINIHFHDSIEECYRVLRSQGFRLLATALGAESHDLYDVDMTGPTALVFGNEKDGVSDAGIALADATVYIPMQGMVESLNISVSCAVSLFEAMRQRRNAGLYEESQLGEDASDSLLVEWMNR